MTLEIDQLEVLKDFTSRLAELRIPHMLTGSMALVHYTLPRTTVDIDLVLDLGEEQLTSFFEGFREDYYIPFNSARQAVQDKQIFNVISKISIVKIDCVVLKEDEFQQSSFSRRQSVNYARELEVPIISKEDLILSKLQWARLGDSERQRRDIATLVKTDFDAGYIDEWAHKLGVADLLNAIIVDAKGNDT